MANAYLVSGVRTPIGSFLGGYKSFSATDLGGVAVKGAMEAASVDAANVDEVINGHAADTEANHEAYPQNRAQKEGLGFPII